MCVCEVPASVGLFVVVSVEVVDEVVDSVVPICLLRWHCTGVS